MVEFGLLFAKNNWNPTWTT